MDNYLASHREGNFISMTMIPTNYFGGRLHQDLRDLEFCTRKQHAEGE